MDRLIFLDIETIASGPPIDPMTLKPPAQMKKAETIAEWYKNEAPTMAEECWKKGSLDSMRGEILCIGYWFSDTLHGVFCEEKEEYTLSCFAGFMKGIMGQYKQTPTFVGWNVKAFDLAWIWRKSVKYGIKELRQSIVRDRYKGNAIDLMEIWATDFKNYTKQADVAAFLGIEDRSNGIDGSQVYDLYKEGRIEEIKQYCLGDVLTVRDIYKRIYE